MNVHQSLQQGANLGRLYAANKERGKGLLSIGKCVIINSLACQTSEKLRKVPSEMSVKKCVAMDVSHIVF